MSSYVLTPRARADIFAIWSFIALDSENAPDGVETAIYEACSFLADCPFAGRTRPDLTSRPVRFWALPRYPNYFIIYRPDSAPLQVIAVLHGKRDIRRALRDR
jgi:plasmid stabilization system protein ParE